MGLQWQDFDFESLSVMIERGVVCGRVGDAKTEYSRDRVPIDPALATVLQEHRANWTVAYTPWVFANPQTGRPYHQDSVRHGHLLPAGKQAGISFPLGWGIPFRHTYRALLDDTGAPMTVQQQLMRHASITTTMNTYGQAIPESKRSAQSKVVQMVLQGQKKDSPVNGSLWEFGLGGLFSVTC
jgi:integrase